jgi:hypothetical protein
MKKKNLSFLSVLVVVAMIAAIIGPMGQVGAFKQHNIFGRAKAADAPPGTDIGGAELTAWIDGVNYGSNVTLPNGDFDLYVETDIWGIPLNDSVKEGGFEGDEIMYFLDYDPMGYHINISTHTSTFDVPTYEDYTGGIYFDTNTWTDPAYPSIPGGTYLRALKINEICLDPSDGWPQYLFIYDPGGDLNETMLEDATHGYYLQVDDTTNNDPYGPIFDFNVSAADVVSTPNNYYYINLTTLSLDSSADELKLVWKNPVNWLGAPTSHNIANGSDVIVDRIEWGNHINNISTTTPPDDREYDNTTLLDCPGLLISDQSYIRWPVNGTDTDNCFSDFSRQPATERPPTGPIIPPDTPGAPTELRVHKGGGAWGGAADDLVLYWKAPTWKWDKLVKNIAYYDDDLSNGFQYTTYFMFDPNSAGPGLDDWCILTGFLGDGNNYTFIVHTTGNTVGVNENMTGTNVGYKFGITLENWMTGIWVSIPYHSDYDFAADLTDDSFPNNDHITAVEKWNYATQGYESRLWMFGMWNFDFDIIPGDAIRLSVNTGSPFLPYTWKIVGAHNPGLQFDLVVNPATTDYMMVSLPYHRTYQNLTHVTNDFTANNQIDIVGNYNYITGEWDLRFWHPVLLEWVDDFDIYASPADAILFEVTAPASYFWTPQVQAF